MGDLGSAAAPALVAPISVRFRLSSCLVRRTDECVIYFRDFWCSPPSIGGGDGLHLKSGSGSDEVLEGGCGRAARFLAEGGASAGAGLGPAGGLQPRSQDQDSE